MTTLSVCGTPLQLILVGLSLMLLAVAVPCVAYARGYGKALTDMHEHVRDEMGEADYYAWLDRYWPEEEPHV